MAIKKAEFIFEKSVVFTVFSFYMISLTIYAHVYYTLENGMHGIL